MPYEAMEIGVCSWSLQVKSISELQGFMDKLGVDLVQIACGDPHHASWEEGEEMPAIARKSGLRMGGTMLGFAGEDYTSPATIEKTGGFGDPNTRLERLEQLKWGLERTRKLELNEMTLHAGFIPEETSPDRGTFLDTLRRVGELAADAEITVAFETGQESSDLLLATLKELAQPRLMVNFDPANMLLYDKDEPIAAFESLSQHVRSVHMKDANRPGIPTVWGEEVPLGMGQTKTAELVKTLRRLSFQGPIYIEREVGTQEERYRDIEHGVKFLRECLK